MIFRYSRYTNTPVILDEGLTSFSKRNLLSFNLTDCPIHTVLEGETLDYISHIYYSNPRLWWAILEANLGTIKEYFDITPGTKLKIPKYEDIMEVLNQNE